MFNIFNLFKKKPPEVNMVGQPIHINVTSNSNKAIKRHLTRISNCRLALKKEAKYINPQRRSDLLEEILKRELQLKVNGVIAPKKISELIQLARKYTR